MTSLAERQNALIGSIYDAALEPCLWTGLAGEIAGAFGASSAAVQTRSSTGVQVVDGTPNIDDKSIQEYEAYYWQTDVWASVAARMGLGEVFTGVDAVPERELRRTEYYADWLRHTDCFHVVGSVFELAPGHLGAIGIHRAEAMHAYDEEDKRAVKDFVPHLVRGLQLRERLRAAEQSNQFGLEALARTQVCVFVVSREGKVVFASDPAARLTQAGGPLGIAQGRLVARMSSIQKALALAIRAAVDIASGERCAPPASLRVGRAQRLPLSLTVQPLRPQDGRPREPLAFVFVHDPERLDPRAGVLQELFGLTAAEALVASRLASGQSVEGVARDNGISENTVRTHVKHIFWKTNTSRQGELVSLVLRCCPPCRSLPDETSGSSIEG